MADEANAAATREADGTAADDGDVVTSDPYLVTDDSAARNEGCVAINDLDEQLCISFVSVYLERLHGMFPRLL